jgi:acyl-CoA carboxylase subunit beta
VSAFPPAARIKPEQPIALTLDARSFRSWDVPLPQLAIEDGYADELAAAKVKSGHDESVITGEGTINGRRVAVVLSEFRFLGGSVGISAATRITEGIEKATQLGLPLLASPVSGGTRMQEGTAAFVQMARITAVVNAHKRARLPYLVYLRTPPPAGCSRPGEHWATSPLPSHRP